MQAHQRQIRELLDRVRSRWQRLRAFRATVRAALAASGVLAVALVLTFWTTRSPMALAALGVAATALAIAALVWGLWPVRRAPSDTQLARFIEESEPSLDDRLASAVDLLASGLEADASRLAGPMVADAARRASGVDPGAVVPREILRRSGFQAGAAVLLLASVAFVGRGTARQSIDALSLMLFPSRVTLEVRPGNAHVQAGSSVTIEARLVGNRAPVVARLLRAEGVGGPPPADPDAWSGSEMIADTSGAFKFPLESVGASFRYRVVAGTVTSRAYDITVARPPRVTRIDVDYAYPPSFGLQPRTEEDGGDIYAPAGTDVRVRIHTDRDAPAGHLVLGAGETVALTPLDGRMLSGALKILADGSYRVALADREGFRSPGETEYFIRMLEDQPPSVRILRPARDRTVTPLEEVDIEAQAEDDFGIDRLDLVYSVRGGAERVVPLDVPRSAASVTGRHTLYLEDLDVVPGDFVSYYVRARDVPRGKRSSETRSDIFFLEVKPFEQEFTLAQSQAVAAGGGRPLDDLVSAQKEIIVATWKLDRRALAANGARSEQDIRSVGRAEAELKTRVEETSSAFRTSTMRDPRRGQSPGGRGRGATPQPDAPGAGQTLPEEDAMTAVSAAMGKAVASLDGLKTKEALPSEMEALNHLLKADADVKKRELTRGQGGRGNAPNRNNLDLSALFDKELQKHQTNYETPTSSVHRDDGSASALDKVKDLARRQDELLRRQQDLARERERMTPADLKRELEKLTREQSELRQRAEDLARQMASQQSQSGQQSQGDQQSQSAQQNQAGPQRSQSGQPGQPTQGQSGQSGPLGQSAGGGQKGQQMRDISEEMRSAASDLRRQDPTQASERGSRALEKLRELERQLQSSAPDERRRARGDLQLEARQLADAERQLESELGKLGESAKDGLRRLAGEQERTADRARRLQQGLSRQGAAGPADSKDGKDRNVQQTVGQAARDFEQQRVGDRMQQSAEQMRAAARQPDAPGKAPGAEREAAKAAAATGRDLARALDKLANTLARAEGPRDDESRKLSEQRARAQELHERIDDLTGQLTSSSSSSSPQRSPGDSGRAGQGAGGGSAGDLARLREEYKWQLQQTRELIDELRREDPGYAQGGPGFTFEGQGMTLWAPGTEAFKQDFAKWEELRKQATQALERAESSLSKKLQAQESRDRLAAGVDDIPPAAYQQQVESYFKALATKAKP